MNWTILSLPLIVSVSLLLGSLSLFLSTRLFSDLKVPPVERKEPDIEPVKTAFSKIFQRQETRATGKVTLEETGKVREIKLLGTAIGSRNLALLLVNKRTFVLSEGEEREGIKLKKVYRKKVLVVINGKEITLKLEVPKANSSIQVKSFQARGLGEFRISRREIERVTKDPGIMFREIRLVPYVKNGKTEGFIFEWIKPGSLFYRAGLREGDILLSINNMTIRSGEDAFRILQILRNEPSLRVVVLRKGKRREINVRIE